MAEGDEAVGALADPYAIDGDADTAGVDVEARPRELPALAHRAPEHGAQEAQPRLVRGAHARKSHDDIGGPQRHSLGPAHLGAGGGHGRAHSFTHTRWMWM